MWSWQQRRRLACVHCRHSPSCLVNGVRGPWEGSADSKGPTPTGPSSGRSCRLLLSNLLQLWIDGDFHVGTVWLLTGDEIHEVARDQRIISAIEDVILRSLKL